MMLASTIQISRYGRPQACHMPRYAARASRSREPRNSTGKTRCRARFLRTQQRAHPAPPPARRSVNPRKGNRTRPGRQDLPGE